jgi:hypothetical protein
MTDLWGRLLRSALAHDGLEVEQQPGGAATPDCPALPLFLRCHRGGDWEQRYRDHFAAGCPYCDRQQRLAARLEAQLSAGTLDPDAEPLYRSEPWEQAPQPPLVFLLVRSRPAPAWMRRGDPSSLRAVPAHELRWHLEPAAPDRVDSDDGPALRLPEEVARRSYNLAAGAAVDLHLDLLLEPVANPEMVVPVVEVTPGPHRDREPLRLVLRFAADCVREFVVRPHALLDKACLRSDPVEPIPSLLAQEWSKSTGPALLDAAFA